MGEDATASLLVSSSTFVDTVRNSAVNFLKSVLPEYLLWNAGALGPPGFETAEAGALWHSSACVFCCLFLPLGKVRNSNRGMR